VTIGKFNCGGLPLDPTMKAAAPHCGLRFNDLRNGDSSNGSGCEA
jgi:hypothetical protein